MGRKLAKSCIIAMLFGFVGVSAKVVSAQQSEAPRPGAPGFEELAHAYNKLSKGDLEGAVKFGLRARSLAPDSEAPVRLLVDVFARLHRPKEALAAADEFARDHDASPSLLLMRANVREQMRDFEGAAMDLQQAREQGGLTKEQEAAVARQLYEVTLAPAYDHLAKGKLREAVRAAEQAGWLNPNAEAPVRVLVEAYEKLGQAAQALAAADRYASRNNASWRLLAQRGYLRRAEKDLSGAEADFKAALARSGVPLDEDAKLREALAEAQVAQNEAAGKPGYAELDRAYKALAAGKMERAIAEARVARAKAPAAEGPVLVLMAALQRLGQPKAALGEADLFAKEHQPGPELLAHRGYLRRSLSDLNGAISDFKAALAKQGLDPKQQKNVRAALSEAIRAKSLPVAESGAAPGLAASPAFLALNRAYDALKRRGFSDAARAAREARRLEPTSETPTLVLIDALTKLGKKYEAIREADYFLRANPRSAAVLAQRGFLRRQTNDVPGAISDFERALQTGGLAPQTKATVADALDEARYFLAADKAFKAAARRDWKAALTYSRLAERFRRADEAIFRLIIEALAQLNRPDEALGASNVLIARGNASGQAYAQRGYLRERNGDHVGAANDFAVALSRGGLASSQRQEFKRSLALAKSSAAEARGDENQSLQELLSYLRDNPEDAKVLSAVGAYYVRHKQYSEALAFYEKSLAVKQSGDELLNAAYASVHVNRAKESQYFREALDLWSRDPTLNTRPERERETIKAQIVEADQSIRTNLALGVILGRARRWGGHQLEPSVETAMRFDGRYLPYVNGLEAFVGGNWSQDQTRFTESYSRVGLRLRPLEGVNFSISGEFQHRFNPKPLDQFALSWAYGYGGFAYASAEGGAAESSALQGGMMSYPLESGWRLLTSFSTYGTFRTGEKRYLQDALGLLGYAYWSTAPRVVVGPAAMLGASYDSLEKRPFAYGVGPAIVLRTWIGGDQYRAYDGLITLQIGYLFPFGESRRQGGLRTRLGITF